MQNFKPIVRENYFMPSSPFSTMVGIMRLIDIAKPKSILDIGVGFGKTGFLIREYFDLNPDKKKGYADWSIRIDGIEIYDKYLTPVHKYIYDTIFIGNALDILSEHNLYYDMILAIDVLEHFNKIEAYKFIDLCKGRSRITVISTPYIYYKQGEEYFNKYEAHLSGWDCSDFKQCGCRYMWRHGISLVSVFTDIDFDLPSANEIHDEVMTQDEFILLKDLILMYYNTEQTMACIDTSNEFIHLFEHDHELQLILALSYEKLKDFANACKYARNVLEKHGVRETIFAGMKKGQFFVKHWMMS